MITIVGIFTILHGLVHLLYTGQSLRLFEMQPGLVWPDNSWAFLQLLGNETTRKLSAIVLIIAAILFAVGGFGIVFSQTWWRLSVISAAVFSTFLYLLCWNGRFERLDDNGFVGILINIVLLIASLVLNWPKF